jgi:hypothetical protein
MLRRREVISYLTQDMMLLLKIAFSSWKCKMILETESEEGGDVKGTGRPRFGSQRNRSAVNTERRREESEINEYEGGLTKLNFDCEGLTV